MTALLKGDRVRVTFEGTVHDANDERCAVVADGQGQLVFSLNVEHIERLKPAEPTQIGAVVRITRWTGCRVDWTAILTKAGWRVSVDSGTVYTDLRDADEWESLYEGNPS